VEREIMRNMLVEKNWINVIAAMSLAILPFLVTVSQTGLTSSQSSKTNAVQIAEISAD
jgi:predicted metalloprotease